MVLLMCNVIMVLVPLLTHFGKPGDDPELFGMCNWLSEHMNIVTLIASYNNAVLYNSDCGAVLEQLLNSMECFDSGGFCQLPIKAYVSM